jgi:hypothetical protein
VCYNLIFSQGRVHLKKIGENVGKHYRDEGLVNTSYVEDHFNFRNTDFTRTKVLFCCEVEIDSFEDVTI